MVRQVSTVSSSESLCSPTSWRTTVATNGFIIGHVTPEAIEGDTIAFAFANGPTPVTGAVYTAAFCYANCDASTVAPVLNVADFSCFINRFAAGNPAANCDQSTIPPTLNVSDFVCFINRFATGCP